MSQSPPGERLAFRLLRFVAFSAVINALVAVWVVIENAGNLPLALAMFPIGTAFLAAVMELQHRLRRTPR